jgi:hypothetical protein
MGLASHSDFFRKTHSKEQKLTESAFTIHAELQKSLNFSATYKQAVK